MPGWLLVAGATLLLLGSVLPWVDLGIISVSGMEGDGVITLVLALIAASFATVALVQKHRRAWPFAVAVGFVLLALAVVVYHLFSMTVRPVEFFGTSVNAMGAGLPVAFIGGAMGLGACIWGIVVARRARKAAPPAGQVWQAPHQ